ncbi:CocE/NonD family hydrolase [Ancylobacter dichloromethanicus]|uniref:Peptidase S15 n=1 Tax=Ancylobacter dichloromethanicus TaxID=518825 RepID=A0A9W6N1X2_9HYPH|nr:CocE/NonD family hydrolase [Ancylobacter dichloromethanicus]MBS7553121.1 CocE/NonD family hydrolase [Ancylobacter dichloromethanicus]GLK74638.1 peptidase S15 [Ancylobacter dichloromethanicus]
MHHSAAPHEVECQRNIWIPMPDGVRLAARLWRPAGLAGPVPAVVEYIPYRKSDGMAARDAQVHPFFAAHGYAALRIDIRGSGDSEGLLADEYTPQEQADALAALEWIAAQPWCDGRIGMMGISWGGFNALQVAALRPPQLKAIITVGSTDDRYADDVHYMGGCPLSANLTWSQTFFADLSRPQDPDVVGERWRDMWLERVDRAALFIAEWTRHPLRDAYWRHGSVREDYSRIEVPVLAVGGWADSYTNAVPRLVAGLPGMRRGLIGPWGHDYPHLAVPGPQIDFLGECLRWWDRWLKGRDTAVESEPLLRVWLQHELPADPAHVERPGSWVGFDSWPSPDVSEQALFLGTAKLEPSPPQPVELRHLSPLDSGFGAGEWCAYGVAADQPTDQREDDARSLCFDTPPLEEDLSVIGQPVLRLELAVDRPRAMVAVRLNDIAPDGSSARVSYGLLNLNHVEGHDRFVTLEPGRPYTVAIALNDIGHRFKAGHRLRVAVSTSYWPTAWPSPEAAMLSVFTGTSRLELPVWQPGAHSRILPDMDAPVLPTPDPRETLRAGSFRREHSSELVSGTRRMHVQLDYGEERIKASGMVIGRINDETYEVVAGDPLSACIETGWIMTMVRGDWSIRTESLARMTGDADSFHITARLDLFEGDALARTRTWDVTIPREGTSNHDADNSVAHPEELNA